MSKTIKQMENIKEVINGKGDVEMSDIEQKECKKSYYAVIPATVRYDKNIMTGAKLLYGEITALCNEKGYCWATNEYFANLYGVNKRTIINWIKSLADAGYIQTDIKYKDGTKQIDKRMISLPYTPISKKEVKCAEPQKRECIPSEKNFTTPDVSDFTTPSEKKFTNPVKEFSHPSEEIFTAPSEKNCVENITYKNNTSNNTVNERVCSKINNKTNTDDDSRCFHHPHKNEENFYGRYGNVYLTKQQYITLTTDYGQAVVNDYIGRVDMHCQKNGRTYNDYEAVIRSWIDDDKYTSRSHNSKKRRQSEREHSFDLDEFDEFTRNCVPNLKKTE